jgi:hypothetical protein
LTLPSLLMVTLFIPCFRFYFDKVRYLTSGR